MERRALLHSMPEFMPAQARYSKFLDAKNWVETCKKLLYQYFDYKGHNPWHTRYNDQQILQMFLRSIFMIDCINWWNAMNEIIIQGMFKARFMHVSKKEYCDFSDERVQNIELLRGRP